MNFDQDIDACITALKAGKLILYPTDTVWGIGCDALNSSAIQKIIHLKKRADNKSFVILMSSIDQIAEFASLPSTLLLNYQKESSKPVTFILPGAQHMPEQLTGSDQTAAIRIPDHKFCQEILKILGRPIVPTSANISGEPTPALFTDITPDIIKGVDYVAYHGRNINTPAASSSIIRENKEGHLEIVRL